MQVLKWSRKRPKTPQPRHWDAKIGSVTVASIEEVLNGNGQAAFFHVTLGLPDGKKGERGVHRKKPIEKKTLEQARTAAEHETRRWLKKAQLRHDQPQ